MGEAYLVRAFTVPVRVSRLRKLVNTVAEEIRVAEHVVDWSLVGDSAYAWSLPVRRDVLATLWKAYMLERVRRLLEAYARIVLGENYRGEVERLWRASIGGSREDAWRLYLYLTGLADVLAYMLRYPLYREPIRPGRGGRGAEVLGLYTPSLIPLIARISWIMQEMEGGAGGNELEAFFNAMEDVWSGGRGLEGVIADIVSGIVDERTSYQLELLFYLTTADTRPGGNTSSLLLHLLMVSAGAGLLAASIARERGDGASLDVPVVRLAGLLHDAGKPVDPEKHVDESVELARSLLEGLVPGELLEIITSLIRVHHSRPGSEALTSLSGLVSRYQGLFRLSGEELHRVLVCADHSMTGLDRILGLVLGIARGEISRIPGHLEGLFHEAREALGGLDRVLGGGEDLPNLGALEALLRGGESGRVRRVREAYWRLLRERDGVGLVARASEAVARIFSALRPRSLDEEMDRLLTRGGGGWPPPSCQRLPGGPRLGVGVVDIGGIQSTLAESFKLRSLAGLSLLVDYLTQALVPYALATLEIPLEAVVFAGGGTIQFLTAVGDTEDAVERRITQRIWDAIKHRSLYEAALQGIRIRVGVSALEHPLYSLNVERAYQRIAAARLRQDAVTGRVTPRWLAGLVAPLARPCDSCGRRPAVVSFQGEGLCLVCAARYKVSSALGYVAGSGYRTRLAGSLLEAVGRRDLQETLLEQLLSRGFDPLRLIGSGFEAFHGGNYAVIKSDGNSMGLFMSSSLTATMFFERSIRVDLATKNGLATLFEALLRERRSGQALGAALSLVYGFMYAGGDDLLLFLPARIALPAAVLLAYEFSAELGFTASLSIGVTAAPYKHNIWWSLDAANTLLDEVAKERARPESVESLKTLTPVRSGGMVAFDYTDGWGLNAARALRRHESLARDRLTAQPLPVLGESFSLLGLLASITGVRCPVSSLPGSMNEDTDIRRCISGILRSTVCGSAADVAKQVYKSVMKGVSRAGGLTRTPGGLDLVATALLGELGEARASGETATARVLSMLLESYAVNHVLPLHDVYLVYKFLRGD